MNFIRKICNNPYTGKVKRILFVLVLLISALDMIAFIPRFLALDFVLTKITTEIAYLIAVFVLITAYLTIDFMQNIEKPGYSLSFSLLFGKTIVHFFQIFLLGMLHFISKNGMIYMAASTSIQVCSFLSFTFVTFFFAVCIAEISAKNTKHKELSLAKKAEENENETT